MWALEVLNCNYSLNSRTKKGKLFSVIFLDSDIGKNFQKALTKAIHIVYYGLAPHFKEMLLDNLKEVLYIFLCFNELYDSVRRSLRLLSPSL